MSSPQKESPKGKESAAAPRCGGRSDVGAAPLLDLSPLLAQFNREMLQVGPAGALAQGAAREVGWKATGSLSCELWGGVGCTAGRIELPARAKPWLWHEIMFGCLSLAVSPRERGSAHTRALLPLRVRMLLPSPFSSAQPPSLPSSVGTEMAGGLLPCHGGKNAWVHGCTGEQGAARRDALCRDVLCRLACLGKAGAGTQ